MKTNISKKVLSGILLGASVLSLVACSTQDKTKDSNNNNIVTTTKTSENKHEFKFVANSSFYVTKDKKVVAEKDVPADAILIEWYLDPFCPACVKLETLISEQTGDLYQDNVYIKYYPMSFLDANTRIGDEEFGYSAKTSAYILGVAEFAPDRVVDFMNTLVNLDFRPDDGVKSEAEYKQAFLKVGGTEDEWKKVTEVHEELMKQNKNDTTEAYNSKKLKARSAVNDIYVPFILIGPDNLALDFETDTDSVQYVLDKINEYKEHKKSLSQSVEETEKTEESTTEDKKEEN